MYIFMYIVSPYDFKDAHYSFYKNIHLHKMYAKKSMHWKVAPKQQVQLLFSI